MSTTPVTIDLEKLRSDIQKLSPEDVAKQLLEVRTKQRVQQKKYHNTDAAKKYRLERAAKIKEMAVFAKSQPATEDGYANLYEQIKAKADAAADQKLGEQAAEEDELQEA